MDSIDFFVDQEYEPGTAGAIVPVINGVRLDELVTRFESESGFDDPAGGYGGLIRQDYEPGTTEEHFLSDGEVAVLGCECGEWGCWPLLVEIETDGDAVTWQKFRQPHREKRDYSAFGPFVFDSGEYQLAVRKAVARAGGS